MKPDVGENFQVEVSTEATSMRVFILFQEKDSFILPDYYYNSASYVGDGPLKEKLPLSKGMIRSAISANREKLVISIPNTDTSSTRIGAELKIDRTGIII